VQPDVKVTYAPGRKYWFVRLICFDRNKLLFDLVCTFVDLDFDVFHATLDTEDADGCSKATMEFYVRPRLGGPDYDPVKGRRLAEMLRASVLRRLPKGLKLHVQTHEVRAWRQPQLLHSRTRRSGTQPFSNRVFTQGLHGSRQCKQVRRVQDVKLQDVDARSDLGQLTKKLVEAGLTITRASVKPSRAAKGCADHTFYVVDNDGNVPPRAKVRAPAAPGHFALSINVLSACLPHHAVLWASSSARSRACVVCRCANTCRCGIRLQSQPLRASACVLDPCESGPRAGRDGVPGAARAVWAFREEVVQLLVHRAQLAEGVGRRQRKQHQQPRADPRGPRQLRRVMMVHSACACSRASMGLTHCTQAPEVLAAQCNWLTRTGSRITCDHQPEGPPNCSF
jgi:hypothetical protein